MQTESIEEEGARLALELAQILANIARLDAFNKKDAAVIHENYAEARVLVDAIGAHLAMNGGPE